MSRTELAIVMVGMFLCGAVAGFGIGVLMYACTTGVCR